MSNHKITSIDKDTFSGLNNLTEIRLNNNQITSIYIDTFSSLNSLTKIDLDNNEIAMVTLEVKTVWLDFIEK